ncbi:MAG: nicotinate phosphoribosyltransferase [Candidatus Marinimicrobia bacterium]|nr:nicotinate phosphoribosyltransferase [Candidatus Neomarinimicrobiota bacterium]
MLRVATIEDIKEGKVTDIYFKRTERILREKGIDKEVVVEFTAKSLPNDYSWAIFSGLSDVLSLMEGKSLTIEAIPEGSIFIPDTPVMKIKGRYLDFGKYETTILGLICQASGIATQSARFYKAAKGKPILSFGTRRMHPSICTIIDRNAYIGGCSGISTSFSAEVLGIEATGTIPHALVLLVGDTVEAIKCFDDVIPVNVPRVALIDTFNDEKFEAIRVAEALGDKLYAIRLDTPSSRRGNFKKILEEIRWELDIRGYKDVKIVVSGGLSIDDVSELSGIADMFGVGTSISNAPVIDFAMDIVEIGGEKISKKGKKSGSKDVYIGNNPLDLSVYPSDSDNIEKNLTKLNIEYIRDGRIVHSVPDDFEIRKYVLKQISELEL